MLPTAKNIIVVFCVMRPCGLVERHYRAAGNCYIYRQHSSVTMEAAVTTKSNFILNVSTQHSTQHTAHSTAHSTQHAAHSTQHTLRLHGRPQFKYRNYALIFLFYYVGLEDQGDDARGVWLGNIVDLD